MVRKIRVLLPIIIITIILGIFGLMYVPKSIKNKNLDFPLGMIKIDNETIKVEIADSPSDRQRWLTFREGIPLDSGMLLVYEKSDLYPLWLLNIEFNLDLIWFNDSGSIVNMIHNASPCKTTLDVSYCTYKNTQPTKYILATTSGFIDIHKIRNDSKIRIISI